MQAREPVLLITGDSGVGKSTLLARLLDEGRARGQVTTSAARLEFRPGALQQALLEQLASVTASLVAETSMVQRVGELPGFRRIGGVPGYSRRKPAGQRSATSAKT